MYREVGFFVFRKVYMLGCYFGVCSNKILLYLCIQWNISVSFVFFFVYLEIKEI